MRQTKCAKIGTHVTPQRRTQLGVVRRVVIVTVTGAVNPEVNDFSNTCIDLSDLKLRFE